MHHKKLRVALMADVFDRRPERSIFIRRLIEYLIKQPDVELYLLHYTPMPDEPLYRRAHEILLPSPRLPWGSHFVGFVKYCLATKDTFDIFHILVARPYPFFWLMPAKKIVVTAHDGGSVLGPGIFSISRYIFNYTMQLGSRYIDAVIGVSRFGSKQIVEAYHVPESKVHTIYNGIDEIYSPRSEMEVRRVLDSYSLQNFKPQEYFMYLGGMQPQKNIPRLLDAYFLYRGKGWGDEKLLLVGNPSVNREEIEKKIQRSPYKDDVIHIFYVPFEDIPALYSGARVFVFVSLNEGFGLPPVEAMACGTPTIVSNRASLPEVTGGGALLVDPLDERKIAKEMWNLADSPLRRGLAEKGKRIAQRYTWERYGKQNLQLYRKLLQ